MTLQDTAAVTRKDLESFANKFSGFFNSLGMQEQAILHSMLAPPHFKKPHPHHVDVIAGFADGTYVWIDNKGHIHVESPPKGPLTTEMKDYLAGFVVGKAAAQQLIRTQP